MTTIIYALIVIAASIIGAVTAGVIGAGVGWLVGLVTGAIVIWESTP